MKKIRSLCRQVGRHASGLILAGLLLQVALPARGQTPIYLSENSITGGSVNVPVTVTPAQTVGVSWPNYILGTSLTLTPTNGVVQTNLLSGPYVITFAGYAQSLQVLVPGTYVTNYGLTLPVNLADPRWLLTSQPYLFILTNNPPVFVGTNGVVVRTNASGAYVVDGSGLDPAGAAAAATNGMVVLAVTNWPAALVTNTLSGAGWTNANGPWTPWTNLFSNVYLIGNGNATMLAAGNGGNLTSHAYEIDDSSVTVNHYYADTLTNGVPVWVAASTNDFPPPNNQLVTSSSFWQIALPFGPIPTASVSNTAYAQSVSTVQANNAAYNLSPGWRWYNYFGSALTVGSTYLFVSTGGNPTNMVTSPVPIFADPNTNAALRDPSVIYFGGQYLLTYYSAAANNALTALGGDGFATSPDGFHFSFTGYFTWSNAVCPWAPEWFVDPTNGLHVLVYLSTSKTPLDTATWIADVTNVNNLTNLTNVRQIPNVTGSDPYLLYTNGLYYLFTSSYEYVSTNLAANYNRIFTNASGYQEGSVVQNINGTWWWFLSNLNGNYYTYSTSTNLTNWTSSVYYLSTPSTTWSQAAIPQQGDFAYYPGIPANAQTNSVLAQLSQANAVSLTNFLGLTVTNSPATWLVSGSTATAPSAGLVSVTCVVTNSQIVWLTNQTTHFCLPFGNTVGLWTNYDTVQMMVKRNDVIGLTNISGSGGATLYSATFQSLQ